MIETIIIVRQNNYWGSGETLPEARTYYKRASGKYPTSGASILAFTGEPEDILKIRIDEVDGSINYPKSLQKVQIQ